MVAVGSGKQTGEGFGSGTGKDALIVKSGPLCKGGDVYAGQGINGEADICTKLAW